MREDRVPHKRLECIRGIIIYGASNFKWMTPYLKGLHPTIDGWRERCKKYFYKTKSQPRIHLKVWEWENDNWMEERELETLSMDKDETVPEWLDMAPRLREDIVVLKRLTDPENPAVTRCRVLESMTAFHLLGDASGQ